MNAMLSVSSSDIIGIIVAVALIAFTAATVYYLLSKKDRPNG